MEKFGRSQPVRRVEDLRFLTGAGRYMDDIAPEGALKAVFFRSPVAHGRIAELDVSEAAAAPGVHLVLTADDLVAAGLRIGMTTVPVRNRDGSKGHHPERPLLARGAVRHVGEAVAMIVADSVQAARDAAELILLDTEELPVSLGRAPGGPTIHQGVPGNHAFDYGIGDEVATDRAFARAAHVIELEVEDNRIIANSMEPRGCLAEMVEGRLHVALSGQNVWGPKRELAETLNMDPDDVRVTIPDVGGGFGTKAMVYPEYFVIAHAARVLNRPVHWMSDRGEAMLSDNAGRDLDHRAALAFDSDLRLIGYRLTSRCNLGAYNSGYAQNIQTELFSKVLTGVYDVQAAWLQVDGVFTNTTPVDAYRGAGRPEAIYVLERAMDRAARELGVDPWELRRRNFIPADRFPYRTVVGETYDVGDFHRVLDSAAKRADLAGYAARKAASERAGRLRGQGLCFYIESILGAPSEDVKITFDEDGGATIYVGTISNGQGHETVYARFLSDQSGIPMERIRVVQGDTDLIARGGGTGGSRSVTVQANVTLQAVGEIVTAYSAFLAERLGVDPADVSFDDEQFRVAGSNEAPSMLDVAAMARAEGRADLLSFSSTATLPARSFPNGAHVAEVEVDPETGRVTVERYTVVDDFGNLINPMLAEGQVHGGVAQGLGQALTERVFHDEDGQLLTASFMDYAMPRADDLPMIGFSTEAVPSTANVLGMKGCGEAGTVGALAAIANAVQDALWPMGVRQADMPFTPHRVWQMLNDARIAAE